MKNSQQVRDFIKTYKNVSGVYAIVNTETLRRYVGSSINLGRRIESHFCSLNRTCHENKDLQSDFNLKDHSIFIVQLLDLCTENELLTLEFEWQNRFQNLYNKVGENAEIKLTFEQEVLFWSKVRLSNANSCWDWLGCQDEDGYGRIGFRQNGKKRIYRANRLAYYLTWPDHNKDLIVRHTCNNPRCCNPYHLILGSFSANTQDVLRSKDTNFTREQVRLIRQKLLLEPSIHQKKLAEWVKNEFGILVKPSILMMIGYNKRYYDPTYTPPKRYIDDDVAKLIRSFSGQIITIENISSVVNQTYKLKLKNSAIWRILKNQRIIDRDYVFDNKIILDKFSKKTPQYIKEYIINSNIASYARLVKRVKEKFDFDLTDTAVKYLRLKYAKT